ncbi:MAG: 3-deoxy-manno-octulosonate cytidylyltransferase, partial [Bacteroidales bacterium]|nr:3-deoxy-manno-octulosonate cytidylyltransferase [Bacteroidales bacterium]
MIFLGIIPARYASTRFPGKPLADIGGESMIERVYERASMVLDEVLVATDDERIYQHLEELGKNVVMTSDQHQSGTDRCSEAVEHYMSQSGKNFDAIINIQGDEPFMEPKQIIQLMDCFHDSSVEIATLVKQIESNETLFDPNKPKVVTNNKNEALYFSRSAIPFLRDVNKNNWHIQHKYFQHIGLYGYRIDILHDITRLDAGDLEVTEALEQLRWLENGYKI